MQCDEIFAALAMLEKERGISQTFMMDKIVQALTTAYKRDHEGVENVIVDVDENKKDLKMYVQKEVVEEVEFPGTQMSVEEARAISAKYAVGDIVNIPVDHVEFGRIAAGNGKQVIIQGLREAESGMVYEEYNSKQHEILTGVVTQIDPRTGKLNPAASELKWTDDWNKDVFRNGVRQEYNLSIAGGTEKTQVYLSASYLNDEGYVPNSGFDRITVRAKVDQTIYRWLKAGLNFSYSNTVQQTYGGGSSSTYNNLFFFGQTIAPIYPIYRYDLETGEKQYASRIFNRNMHKRQ